MGPPNQHTRVYEESDMDYKTPKHRGWKLGLRIITLCMALVPLGLCSYYLQLETGQYLYSSGLFYDSFMIAASACSLIWNIAEIITYSANKRGIHPGAHVGCDLIIWIVFTTAFAFYILRYESYASDELSYALLTYISNLYTSERPSQFLVVIVFGAFCTLLHFVLFVWACVDTHRRRQRRRHIIEEALRLAQAANAQATANAENINQRGNQGGRVASYGPIVAVPVDGLAPPPPGMMYVMPAQPMMQPQHANYAATPPYPYHATPPPPQQLPAGREPAEVSAEWK